jgi:hypothetical protein
MEHFLYVPFLWSTFYSKVVEYFLNKSETFQKDFSSQINTSCSLPLLISQSDTVVKDMTDFNIALTPWCQWHRGVSDTMESVTPWSQWHCGVSDTVESVTPLSQWHRGISDTVKLVTLWSQWHHGVSDTVVSVTPWSQWHSGVSDTVESVTLRYQWLRGAIDPCCVTDTSFLNSMGQ